MLRNRENNELSRFAHMQMPVTDSETLPPPFSQKH